MKSFTTDESFFYVIQIVTAVGAFAAILIGLYLLRRWKKSPSTITHYAARRSWHDRSLTDISAEFDADPATGLSTDEARRRLQRDGLNELRKGKSVSALVILFRQFTSLVIWVLIGAAAVSAYLGEKTDGIAIISIVVLNALVGFIQEFRAENAAAALARLAAPKARVMRDSHTIICATSEVVAGEVLLLEPGDLVAADARLIDAYALRTNEASLTGESLPVEKSIGSLPLETPLADRGNMVFLGTNIAGGSARALVVATGMRTELGRIAQLLDTAESGATPLQKRLDSTARYLLWACLAIVALVFILGLLRSIAPFELFLSAISLAVAAIPEGLPAVVTVALALGVQRMIRRNALVRRLQSVETLGCAEVICTDKTGTLTVGEMTARRLVAGRRLFRVSGEGYDTEGTFICESKRCTPSQDAGLHALLYAAAACNDAEIVNEGIMGDPTEGALLVAAAKGGINRGEIETSAPRLTVLPFDSDRKRMTVVRRQENAVFAFTKGAPEIVLARCAYIQDDGAVRRLTDEDRAVIHQSASWMANEALRILAVAQRSLPDSSGAADQIERELIFLGLFCLQAPQSRGEERSSAVQERRHQDGDDYRRSPRHRDSHRA